MRQDLDELLHQAEALGGDMVCDGDEDVTENAWEAWRTANILFVSRASTPSTTKMALPPRWARAAEPLPIEASHSNAAASAAPVPASKGGQKKEAMKRGAGAKLASKPACAVVLKKPSARTRKKTDIERGLTSTVFGRLSFVAAKKQELHLWQCVDAQLYSGSHC